MNYPRLKDVELIIRMLNKRYNMDITIINKGQFEFVLEKPKIKFYGKEQYLELYEKAAVLMESFTKAHTLSDGNKRTAMAVAGLMIKMNGGELVSPLKSIRLSVDTAMDEHDLMPELIRLWFKVHTAMNTYQLCAMLCENNEEERIIKKLLMDKKYKELDGIMEAWLAFDNYPENKETGKELIKQWKEKHIVIDKKHSLKSNDAEGGDMWKSITGLAKQEPDLYGDHIKVPVEKISDLQYHNNSMKELVKAENRIKKDAKEFENTTDHEIIYQNCEILTSHRNYSEARIMFERL